jgi:hypothetical protein
MTVLIVAAGALGALGGGGRVGGAPTSADAAEAAEATTLLTIRDPRITESSGLAASGRHRGVLWTINDSGDGARVYGVGADGRTRAVVRLAGLEPRDWEAIAPANDGGTPVLWVADIGDNRAVRTRGILVHRLVEPQRLRDTTVRATSYRLRYPDGPHDAEALLVEPRTGRLLIVTKDLFGGAVYAAPDPLVAGRPNVLERVAAAPAVVTDGAALPDGRLVLRTYSTAYVYAALGADPVQVALPDQPQGESLAATADGRAVVVGSEGLGSAVWRVSLPARPGASGRPRAGVPAGVTSLAERSGGGAVIGAVVLGVVAVALVVGRLRRRHR